MAKAIRKFTRETKWIEQAGPDNAFSWYPADFEVGSSGLLLSPLEPQVVVESHERILSIAPCAYLAAAEEFRSRIETIVAIFANHQPSVMNGLSSRTFMSWPGGMWKFSPRRSVSLVPSSNSTCALPSSTRPI